MVRRRERIVSMEEAISHIKDGDSVGLSGSVLFHQPMALVRALIKRGVKDLTIVTLTGGIASDLLIGSGCVKKVVSTYMGMQHYAPICPNFRREMERGSGLQYWECDFQHFHCAMKATQWGMPYLLTKAGVGTDVTRLNPDLKLMEVNGEPWVAVPPVPIDVALLYVNKADPYGNGIYNGNVFMEGVFATCASRLIIVAAEEIVPNEVTRHDPRVTVLGGPTRADFVVDCPYGAHPDEGQGYYMHDADHVKEYVSAAEATRRGEDPDAFKRYLDKYVYAPNTHAEYLEAIGGITRLLKLRQSML